MDAPAEAAPQAPLSPQMRRLTEWLSVAITVLAILWAIDVPYYLRVAIFREQFMIAVLACGLVIVLVTIRADKTTGGRVPWYDACAAAIGFLTLAWMGWQFPRLTQDVVGYRGTEAIVIGVIIVPLVLEGLRRATGYTLFWVVMVFIVYSFVADKIPGKLQGTPIDLDDFFIYLAFDPTAIFGSPMVVGTTVVIAFIFFGQLLVKAGGGEFFTDIAMSTMGRSRGGAAKIAVVGSCLFGMISGSAVSNVASVGVVTIPLMRRSGYTPVQAAAIESVSSTGGQFMPPVMGAAAFLMAEFLEIPYRDVAIAAAIPALLYYFAVFVEVDLIAGRDSIKTIEGTLPRARDVLKEGWHFIVPFGVLLVAMFQYMIEAQLAAIYSCVAIAAFSSVRGYKGRRITVRSIYESMAETGGIMVELLMILGGAGIVIGILNYTTLGFAFTLVLTNFGGGSLMLLLIVAAIASIILGMGMPTSGIYVLLAPLVAPALVQTGVVPIGAHLFILYFGMMSMLTPPVALCAYAAATIARTDGMTVGFTAMRFAWPAYIVPFLFAVAPTLLLQGPLYAIVIDTVTAFIGVFLVSIGMVGYFTRRMGAIMRIVIAAAGFASLMPTAVIHSEYLINVAGIAVGALILGFERMAVRRAGPAAAE